MRIGHRFFIVPWLALLPVSEDVGEMANAASVSVQVGCEIRATRKEAGTRLDALISASGPVSGTYSFSVDRRGGDKVISEAGDFTIESATPSEVKKAGVDLPPGDGYDALLTIEWPNGSSSCSAAVS